MRTRRTLSAILALTEIALATGAGAFFAVGGAGGVPAAFAGDGFAGEELGLDLYRKVDKGVGKLQDMMVQKRIPGNAKRLNERMGKICVGEATDMGPPPPVFCLDEGKDFTVAELSEIRGGNPAPLLSHLSKEVQQGSDMVAQVSGEVSDYAGKLMEEASRQTQTLGRAASMGLYSDGSLENSSFDLMKDLDNVHAIIFSQNVPYEGQPVGGSTMVTNFASSPGFPSSQFQSVANPNVLGDFFRGAYDAGIGYRIPGTPGWGDASYANPANGPACADSAAVGGLDSALAADIANQVAYGSNAGTAGTPGELAGWAGSASGANAGSGTGNGANAGVHGPKKSMKDTFPCTLFFCIKVDFVMYQGMLLGGGKSYTIESVLDYNFKIVKTFAGASFIQAQHTNNFFELLLKNLSLPSLAHLGVVVQTMPPPILNLNGGDTPRGAPKVSEEQKEFQEVTACAFGDQGIANYKKQNVIDDPTAQQDVRNMAYASSENAVQRKSGGAPEKPRKGCVEAKEKQTMQEYAVSFSSDLTELRAFTKSFTDTVMNLGALSKKFADIREGK